MLLLLPHRPSRRADWSVVLLFCTARSIPSTVRDTQNSRAGVVARFVARSRLKPLHATEEENTEPGSPSSLSCWLLDVSAVAGQTHTHVFSVALRLDAQPACLPASPEEIPIPLPPPLSHSIYWIRRLLVASTSSLQRLLLFLWVLIYWQPYGRVPPPPACCDDDALDSREMSHCEEPDPEPYNHLFPTAKRTH